MDRHNHSKGCETWRGLRDAFCPLTGPGWPLAASEEMMTVVPERGDRFFVSMPGTHVGDFCEAARTELRGGGRTFDEIRWFCREDEVIQSGGRTWAVSNQWGTNTEEVLRRLVRAFPEANVEIEAAH